MQLSVHQDVVGPRLFIATSGVALPIPLLDEVTVGRLIPMQAQSPDLNLEPYGGGPAGPCGTPHGNVGALYTHDGPTNCDTGGAVPDAYA